MNLSPQTAPTLYLISFLRFVNPKNTIIIPNHFDEPKSNVTHSPLTHNQHNYIFRGMNIKSNIGLRIKELRLAKGMSQEQLALRAELDRTYMTSVENGKRNISIQNIEKIINALETTFEEFFKGFDINL